MWFWRFIWEVIVNLITGETIDVDEIFYFIIDSGIIYKFIPLIIAVIVVSRIIIYTILYFKFKKNK